MSYDNPFTSLTGVLNPASPMYILNNNDNRKMFEDEYEAHKELSKKRKRKNRGVKK